MQKIGEIKGNALYLNFIAVIIIGALYRFVFVRAWRVEFPSWMEGVGFLILLAILFILMVAHELIHWATARMILGRGKARIKIRILTWECRVEDYLPRNHYILYALAPGLLIGLIGLAAYYVVPQPDIRFVGAVIFVVGLGLGGGDYWFVYKIQRYPADSYVLDGGITMDIFRREPAA